MKRVAIITFHAAHNYGSVLQAYALQKTISCLCDRCEIINFRTWRQIDLYTVFTKRKGMRYVFKNLSHLLYYFPLRKKHDRFESFISQQLLLTEQIFHTLNEIEQSSLSYDFYVSGSDQIWNPVPADFDWAFYLPFVKNGKRIAYAPSFGQLASVGDQYVQKNIAKYLRNFDRISVRDERAKENVRNLIGLTPPVILDPTLLLKASDWDKIASPDRIYKGDYIFLYTLFANKEILDIAHSLSKRTGFPIVISNFSNQFDVVSSCKKYFDAGPSEFLSLVKNARLVLTSSFHGTVFSILYHKPFFAICGDTDARISSLLSITGLTDRVLNESFYDEQCVRLLDIDFSTADTALDEERHKSIQYLKEALREEQS